MSLLTDREKQVLMLVREGLSNQKIGWRLFIEKGTVAFHMKRIGKKLGTGGRHEAAAKAVELNEI